ncbi:RNA polymerase sigma-70 factor [Mucilaginibacter lappiensis]|uniref:RNA polymerase sigma-70 factor (ECF subfamily) n=1 Tax=Mucilaginibacter lappiensis TaxID=354630 RepID=A0A1N7FS18_9SPHI|nr:RNA polymerase sigma-70 factor [Mucilaginibacter lappiensis]MBB6112560.1 RNA polymerase sigma-70 factor (ECF subfamily) [Mucilaginibacter lappiensis]MBB6129202.1 RNA polymerase sigma-70 factor (ECF subfamily) [Mucilaginibacter lappiensis]SIS03138.1 RNA polymerase sigma-70 factor, ECF subfamily [Mucilaginibacter lappiensis]
MDNKEMTAELINENEAVFEQLFKKHFRELHAYAFSLLKDWDVAEEIVQSLFLKLWEKNEWSHIQTSIKSYLYKSVYHDSLNYIRRQKVQLKYQTSTAYAMKNDTDDAAGKLKMSELEQHLSRALGKLPEKCRAIFQLSRFQELKYQEIATQLDISIKTVETHMGKALRILRKEMKEFLPLIALMLFNMFRS